MDATKVPESVARFAASCRTDAPTYSPDRPSLSAFVMEDGVVYHTYSAYARGVDGIWGMHQWPDRAPKGRMITAAECRAARGLPLDQARSCRAVACLVATHPPRIYRRWIAAGGSPASTCRRVLAASFPCRRRCGKQRPPALPPSRARTARSAHQ